MLLLESIFSPSSIWQSLFSACWLSGNSPPIPIHFKDIIQTLMSLGASQYTDSRTFVTDTLEIQQEEGVSKLSNGIWLPSFWKEGCPVGGVVGLLAFCISMLYVFTYHLPLRVLLLPEGGEFQVLLFWHTFFLQYLFFNLQCQFQHFQNVFTTHGGNALQHTVLPKTDLYHSFYNERQIFTGNVKICLSL